MNILECLAWFAGGTAGIAVGVPRLWFAAAAALALGGHAGCAVAIAASAAGSLITFTAGRIFGRDWMLKRTGSHTLRIAAESRPGAIETAISRQLPMPGVITTLLLAITDIKPLPFAVGSLIGFLPSTVIVTMLGGMTAINDYDRTELETAAIAMTVALVLMAVIKYCIRRSSKFNEDSSVRKNS